jgi:hypothetical protein
MDRITHQLPRPRGYGSTSSLRNDSLNHTRKHERRRGRIEPRGKAHRIWRTVRPGGADCPRRPRGPSDLLSRTVRLCAADCPLKHTEPPEATREKRTVRRVRADRLLLKLGPSANWLQQKPKAKPDRKRGRARTRRTRDEP